MVECGPKQVEGKIKNFKSVEGGKIIPHKIIMKEKIVFDPSLKTILGKIAIKQNGVIIGVGNIQK
jgi:hypothetical protein